MRKKALEERTSAAAATAIAESLSSPSSSIPQHQRSHSSSLDSLSLPGPRRSSNSDGKLELEEAFMCTTAATSSLQFWKEKIKEASTDTTVATSSLQLWKEIAAADVERIEKWKP